MDKQYNVEHLFNKINNLEIILTKIELKLSNFFDNLEKQEELKRKEEINNNNAKFKIET